MEDKMAKEEESRLVLRRMTETQIKNLGGNMFVYSKRKTWTWAFIFGVAFFVVMQFFFKRTITVNVISILPLLVVFLAFLYTINKAGKTYWNKIKNEEEPITIK
jgi:purine-cytosine permease-like protein